MSALEQLGTTVVGSFSAIPGKRALESSYLDGQDPFEQSIRECVELQVEAGVEMISDGQTRNDMIRLFASGIGGIRMRTRPVVIEELNYTGPITLRDQELVRGIVGQNVRLKGIVTGPYTMASSVVDEHYGNVERLAFAFAEVLKREAMAIEDVVDVIQVDEPYFSVEFPDWAGDLVDTVFEGVGKPRALHVCGDVSGIFGNLVELPVDVLDHEFAAHPELLTTVKDFDFKQMIGYGCVRSDSPDVETVEVILQRIKKGFDCIGQERLLLDPDCGLRHVPMDAARKKLENMVKARDVIRDEG